METTQTLASPAAKQPLHRIYNFGAGPAILPVSVLEEAAEGVRELNGSGMSILEVSHRSKDYEEIHFTARKRLLELMGLSADDYDVLFIQGGASMQFAMLALNFLPVGADADYVNAGEWGIKALKEAQKVGRGKAHEAASSASDNYSYIPKRLTRTPGARYLHITTNNTIEGTEWFDVPQGEGAALIADMSSDFIALDRDYSQFDLVYAGAQKNAGPAGVTMVVVRRSLVAKSEKDVPAILSYKTYLDKDSLYNTPPCFAVYVVGLVAKWAMQSGGLAAIERANREKAALLYDALDECSEFYQPAVTAKEDRSLMNVTFRLQPAYEALEKDWLSGALAQGMDGLKGHRNVGGFRASIYNAFPLDGARALARYLREFAHRKA